MVYSGIGGADITAVSEWSLGKEERVLVLLKVIQKPLLSLCPPVNMAREVDKRRRLRVLSVGHAKFHMFYTCRDGN